MLRCAEATGPDIFCHYGSTTSRAALPSPTVLAQRDLQDSSWCVQSPESQPRSTSHMCLFKPNPRPIHRLLVQEVVTTDASQEGYGGHMNNLCFRASGQGKRVGAHTHTNILELETMQMACQWFQDEINGKTILPDRQNNSSSLYIKGGFHPLHDLEWFCKKDPTQIPREWGSAVPRIPQRSGNPLSRCPIQGKEGSGMASLVLGTLLVADCSSRGTPQQWICLQAGKDIR